MAIDLYNDKWKDKLKLIQAWCRDGLTNEQVAHNIGITRQCLYNWCKKYPELEEAMKKGKEVVDVEVENALLKKALGYKYDEVTRERVDGEIIITKVVTKEVQGDTTAQIFWLKNRQPDKWRDRKNIEADVKNENKNIDLSNLTDEQIDKIIRAETKREE